MLNVVRHLLGWSVSEREFPGRVAECTRPKS
jgi:hypothetical protein